MLKKFLQFLEQQNWNLKDKKTLIALSGGIDSVVLCHLFHQAGLPFGIAHCNFKLRGDASDQDEVFVKYLSEILGVDYFTTSFNTTAYAEKEKKSIQLAARDLRYNWLEQIRKKHQYQYIATAHHLNDSIETIFFNFTKGCGIRGLHGIRIQNEYIIRPLLFTSKTMIQQFAKKEAINYREDISNTSTKYHRNLIRHKVIPPLKEINPSFEKTAGENIKRIKDTEYLFEYALKLIIPTITRVENQQFFIEIEILQKHAAQHTILYELLKPFGFNNDQVNQILETDKHLSGTLFFSSTHRLIIDRSHFIVSKIVGKTDTEFIIGKNDQLIPVAGATLKLDVLNKKPNSFSSNKNEATLDLQKIIYPLKLRHWKAGDLFQPLGMEGKHQSLQDFFTNNKLSILEKENTWILESDGKICWIAGHRIDERFKINEDTSKCLKLTWKVL